MNRRLFLHQLTLAASALTLDPERLLWTPGAKTISLPPAKSAQEIEDYLHAANYLDGIGDPMWSNITSLATGDVLTFGSVMDHMTGELRRYRVTLISPRKFNMDRILGDFEY